jgi:hypothetical protein
MLHKREEEVAQVPLAEYDDMIKTFPPDQTNQPFVLPFRHRDCTTVGRSGAPMAACLSRDEALPDSRLRASRIEFTVNTGQMYWPLPLIVAGLDRPDSSRTR